MVRALTWLRPVWPESPIPQLAAGRAIEAEVAERAGQVELAKIHVGAEHPLATRYGIQSSPTVALCRDGQRVTGFFGAHRAATIGRLLDMIAKHARAVGVQAAHPRR